MRLPAISLLVLFTYACAPEASTPSEPEALYSAGTFWEEKFTHTVDSEEGEISLTGEFDATGIDTEGSEEEGRQITKIISPSHVETFDKTGYLAQTVRQVDSVIDETNGYPEEFPTGLPWVGERLFVEDDGWLLELPVFGSRSFIATGTNVSSDTDVIFPYGDLDVAKGQALLPLQPEIGGVYTSDKASVYKAEGVETILDQPTVKLTRIFPPEKQKLATFFEDCFTEGVVFGDRQIRIKESCQEWMNGYWGIRFTPVQESSFWIGGKLRLKSVSRTETVYVNSLCCYSDFGDSCESLYWNYDQTLSFNGCSEDDELFFKGSRLVDNEVTKVTRIGKDADPKTQPKLEGGGR